MRKTKVGRYSKTGLDIAKVYELCLSTLCHHVSNDEYYGQPFLLEDFQRENIWKPLFAAGKMIKGKFTRRFRRAILGLPSGLGKTELSAALVLTIATMEPVHNGQYGVVASSLKQVENIFGKITTMIKLDDTLSSQWDILKDYVEHKETGAKIMVFPNKADALESWHFNVLIFDELHVYRDSKVWDAGTKGQKVIPNALTIAITTAGNAREGFLWDLLERAHEDKAMYLYWLGLDDKDDLDDPKCWKKIMVASWVTWESIQDQRGASATLRAFERYTANRFPQDKSLRSCFTHTQIKLLCNTKNRFDFDRPFVLGIDGATSGDSFAIIGYQEFEKAKFTHEWIYDEPMTETGHYNLHEIAEQVAGITQKYEVPIVGVDPNRLIVFSNYLIDDYDCPIVSVAQNNQNMCAASSLVINSVKDKSLHLQGCPKLTAQMKNVIEDDKGAWGVRFGKDKKRSLIDAPIALAIAEFIYETAFEEPVDYPPFL